MGVDVMYQQLNSARVSTANTTAVAIGANAAGLRNVSDQHQWYGTFRIQRDWVP